MAYPTSCRSVHRSMTNRCFRPHAYDSVRVAVVIPISRADTRRQGQGRGAGPVDLSERPRLEAIKRQRPSRDDGADQAVGHPAAATL